MNICSRVDKRTFATDIVPSGKLGAVFLVVVRDACCVATIDFCEFFRCTSAGAVGGVVECDLFGGFDYVGAGEGCDEG